MTGKGFALDIVRDPQALLGYRLRAIGAGNFATVMLATMEAIHQVARPEAIPLNDFGALWSAVSERVEREMRPRGRLRQPAHSRDQSGSRGDRRSWQSPSAALGPASLQQTKRPSATASLRRPKHTVNHPPCS